MRRIAVAWLIAAVLVLLSCRQGAADEPSPFDGKSLAGWTTQDGKPVTQGWEVVDGVIHLKKDGKRAGHIVTAQEFGDFTLSFEWKIAERGNSGIKYKVKSYGGKVLGCEYQIYDDGLAKKVQSKNSAGALYDLYEPNEAKQLKPAGEYNTGKIVVQGNQIEHWLNGQRIVTATIGDEEWQRRVAASKFNDVADFSRNERGKIMLTDHGSEVWYRNFDFRTTAPASRSTRMQWDVDGLKRDAIVYLPASAGETSSPVVFGFHGHGGTAQNAARMYDFHRLWPEAIVVYMQGVPTPGRLTDPEGKRNGWQHGAGDQGDRDLKFFDAVLASLREKHTVDDSRVYCSGHSNGGGFTYLLWDQRYDVFAAVAPSAAASRSVQQLKPKPALHIAGEQDELVKFAWQKLAMAAVRRVNGCEETGREWAPGCTLYPSSKGAPFVCFIHGGTHKYPEEAPELIVRFFKEHRKNLTEKSGTEK